MTLLSWLSELESAEAEAADALALREDWEYERFREHGGELPRAR